MARIAWPQYSGRTNFINTYVNGGVAILPVGVPIIIGDRVGVPTVDIAVGGNGPVEMSGQWAVPLKTGDTPLIGGYVYWDATNSYMTTTVVNDVRPVMVVTGHNPSAGQVAVDLAMTKGATVTP